MMPPDICSAPKTGTTRFLPISLVKDQGQYPLDFRGKSNSIANTSHKDSLSMKLSRRFPLNALRVFEVVARLENFTRAAEELGMTQTAVSYQIKLLEEYLGDAVFNRKPRALQLTDTGR
jgi:hypothetical protein